MTIEEKLIETKNLENQANLIRDEINRLQNSKMTMYWEHKDTGEIDEELEELKEELIPILQAFEVSLNEVGEDNYYNFLRNNKGEDENDRHKIN